MAEKNNATCSICGSKYHVCLSCKDAMKLHPWKIHCCSADCFKVFQVVKGFSTNVYTKDEFRSKLKNIDLSNLENYREHIKALIKDVLKEDSVEIVQKVKPIEKIETVEEMVENIVTEENVVVEDVETVEQTADIVKATYSRKRNFRVEE
jgi:hypothetical protein